MQNLTFGENDSPRAESRLMESHGLNQAIREINITEAE